MRAVKRRVHRDSHFEIEYIGPALENGEMDVRDLAPALLAVGQFLEETNRSVNGTEVSVSVMVKADFPRGSFGVDYNLAQTLLEHAKLLFAHQHIKDAHDLLELAGFIVSPTWVGYLALRKWLRGRKIEKQTTLEDGFIKLEISGSVVLTKPEVLALLPNPVLSSAAEKMIRPLNKDGIEEIKIFANKKKVQEEIKKSDIPAFYDATALLPTAILNAGQEQMVSRRPTILRLVRPSFKRGNKYQVIEGDTEFYAAIEDQEFLDKVQNDEIKFSAHGRLRVVLRQEIISGEAKDTIEHAIEEVLEYIEPQQGPGAQQPLIKP